MNNIRLISAGAGSGKTYRLTEVLSEKICSGEFRPDAVIATTFTIKAAEELKTRVRQKLLEKSKFNEAEAIRGSYIGTVHSVCLSLIERFCFEAGLSPSLDVIDPMDSQLLFDQALEESAGLIGIRKALKSARRFCIEDWKVVIKEIVDKARENDILPNILREQYQESIDGLFQYLPEPDTDDPTEDLYTAISEAIQLIENGDDSTKTTATYHALLKSWAQKLKNGTWVWKDWSQMSTKGPGVKSRSFAEPVKNIAYNYESHPLFREDLSGWIQHAFNLAADALEKYQRLKEERGVVDFIDQEKKFLELLDLPEVRERLQEEVDLLLVDEFQDTSPIQLSLFMKLSKVVKETVWVGDVKQAIYGFRGTDPELMLSVVEELKKAKVSTEILEKSYRSVPSLVHFSNEVFSPKFSELFSEDKVKLKAERKEDSIDESLQFWTLSDKNQELRADALAIGIQDFVESSKQVYDKGLKQNRQMRFSDIAILCRTNDHCKQISEGLKRRGIQSLMATSDLLKTPEAFLVLSCLKYFSDDRNILAAAEIVALQSTIKPEEWLENRLNYLSKGGKSSDWGVSEDFIWPTLKKLRVERNRLKHLSPSEALKRVTSLADVKRTVVAWEPTQFIASQRIANIDCLVDYAHQYEKHCHSQHASATIRGLIVWLEQLARRDEDICASFNGQDAVHVLTYHKAKGLEWPMVICLDLEHSLKPRNWGVSVIERAKSLDINNPLKDRRIRYWPWPFGKLKSNIPLDDRLQQTEMGKVAREKEIKENLRLLYVSFTRARDCLVLAFSGRRNEDSWLNVVDASWLENVKEGKVVCPDGKQILCREIDLKSGELSEEVSEIKPCYWFAERKILTPKSVYQVYPSSTPSMDGVCKGFVTNIGSRLSVIGKPDMDSLGTALHEIIAFEFLYPESSSSLSVAEEILTRHGQSSFVQPQDVIQSAKNLRSHLESQFEISRYYVEWPIQYVNNYGQLVIGWIDLLLETSEGMMIVDHKSFPGNQSKIQEKLKEYSGQLKCYRDGLLKCGYSVKRIWVYFSVSGIFAELPFS